MGGKYAGQATMYANWDAVIQIKSTAPTRPVNVLPRGARDRTTTAEVGTAARGATRQSTASARPVAKRPGSILLTR